MIPNTIKVKQIDNDELFAFLQSSLGVNVVGVNTTQSYSQVFNSSIDIRNTLSVSGTSSFEGSSTFQSGLVSNSGVYVHGLVSGDSANFKNFNLQSGSIGNFTLGTVYFTGVPIYDSGDAGLAVLLPSGKVFGLKQTINAPIFEKDNNGDIQPATGLGVSVVMLCVSIGS